MSRTVYGLCGFIGSGKDAACQALIEHTDATKFSFAGILKDIVATLFTWDRDMLDGITAESRVWREQIDTYWTKALGFDVTPRQVLQRMGTEVFRNYHREIWIKAVDRRLQLSPAQTAIFTDCRFGNEMEFIRNQQGFIMWVYRPGVTPLPRELQLLVDTYDNITRRAAWPLGQSGLHASETSFLTEGANHINLVLVNNGTLDDLTECVKHAHNVLSTNVADGPLPVLQQTVYLDRFLGHLRWQWRDLTTFQLQSIILP